MPEDQDFNNMVDDLMSRFGSDNKPEPTDQELDDVLKDIINSLTTRKKNLGSASIIVKHNNQQHYMLNMVLRENIPTLVLNIMALDSEWDIDLAVDDLMVDASYKCMSSPRFIYFVWNLKELEELLDREIKKQDNKPKYSPSNYQGYQWN